MIELKDVHKTFKDGLNAVRGVSFAVPKGKTVCVIGPSGSGKSTLIRCINGLEVPTSGEVFIDGEKVDYADSKKLTLMREKTGFVFQQFNLFPHLTVLRNLTLAPVQVLKQESAQAEENALSLLRRVGLADKADSYPSSLSGGQQQRVAIARCLAMQPKVMLLDEPTSALDPEATGDVLDIVKDLSAAGMTMLVVTHEMGFARSAADEVVFMMDGAVEEKAPPEKLFGAPESDRLRDFLAKVLRA